MKVVTYVSKDSPVVTLTDAGFNVKITSLAIIPANGAYVLSCVVGNASGKEARFDPDIIDVKGVDTGLSYQPGMKGKMDRSWCFTSFNLDLDISITGLYSIK